MIENKQQHEEAEAAYKEVMALEAAILANRRLPVTMRYHVSAALGGVAEGIKLNIIHWEKENEKKEPGDV